MARRAALAALGLLCAQAVLCDSVARASDPSRFLTEILTPSGWELAHRCSADDEPASSLELRTPADWAMPNLRETAHWASLRCSELLVPADWAGVFLGL